MAGAGLFGFCEVLAPAESVDNLPHEVCLQGLLVTPAEEPKGPSSPPTRKHKSIYNTVTDTEMVEQVFGFLPSMIGGQEGRASPHSEVRRPVFQGSIWAGRGWAHPVPTSVNL